LYRGINDFKKGYQPTTNTVKDEKGDLVTHLHSILVRWRNHFSQLLHVHGVKEVMQTEILTTEPLVPEPSAFQYEIAIEKLMGNKSPSTHQIPAEMIKVGKRTIHSEIHKLINSICNEEELPEEWKFSINVPKKGDKTDCCSYRGISLLSSTHKILSNILFIEVNSIRRGNYWE
jgi:hypothetical protein